MSEPRPVALVTGGAKRVGHAIALALANAGYDVAFTWNSSEADARKTTELLSAKGAKALALRADLTDSMAIDQVAQNVMHEFGRLSVLVNNASIYEPGDLRDAALTQTRRMWALHVIAPILLCRAFEKQLRDARGHIVNMLDLLAEKPWPKYMAYCASKAALWNLTLSLAKELAPEVTVNGIAPGVVEWPADFPEAEKEKYLCRVPLGRAGTPEDVAKAVVFLCSPGSYITGQVLRLDGGKSVT
jgi:pteridine reductase